MRSDQKKKREKEEVEKEENEKNEERTPSGMSIMSDEKPVKVLSHT